MSNKPTVFHQALDTMGDAGRGQMDHVVSCLSVRGHAWVQTGVGQWQFGSVCLNKFSQGGWIASNTISASPECGSPEEAIDALKGQLQRALENEVFYHA